MSTLASIKLMGKIIIDTYRDKDVSKSIKSNLK